MICVRFPEVPPLMFHSSILFWLQWFRVTITYFYFYFFNAWRIVFALLWNSLTTFTLTKIEQETYKHTTVYSVTFDSMALIKSWKKDRNQCLSNKFKREEEKETKWILLICSGWLSFQIVCQFCSVR